MNNLIIAVLTLVMLPAISTNVSAKNLKSSKESKTAIIVEKTNFSNDFMENTKSDQEYTSVNVDYIIEESGKAYITYIDAENDQAKNDVVKFIESATYNYNLVPGKVYSMKLTLNK